MFLDLPTFKKKFLLCATKLNSDDEYFAEPIKRDERTLEEMAVRYITKLQQVQKDLSKVAFSTDCINISSFYYDCGFRRVRTGFTFYGVSGGDEIEAPVYYILYHDGKSWRGYIPTYGNSYYVKENRAYLYDEVYEDLQMINLRPSEIFPDVARMNLDIETNIIERYSGPKQLKLKLKRS